MRRSLLQELPKSMTLMALRFGWRSRMFSGFKSQWMIATSGRARNASAWRICFANLRTRFSDTPWNCVFFSSSYKL